jgi:hypothetical protein
MAAFMAIKASSRRPELTASDRKRLADTHFRVDKEWTDLSVEPVSLDVPRCRACNEPWGEHGCSTIRALQILAVTEQERDEAVEQRRKSNFALANAEALHQIGRDKPYDIVSARIRITGYAFLMGGMEVVDYELKKVRDNFEKLFTESTHDPEKDLLETQPVSPSKGMVGE